MPETGSGYSDNDLSVGSVSQPQSDTTDDEKDKNREEEAIKEELRGEPSYVTTSPININGLEGDRLMVVYRTTGCAYDKDGKGCTMCDFSFYADPNVKDQNLKDQHAKVMERLLDEQDKDFIHFDLLTLGNFYNDREISPEMREYFLRSVATVPGLKRVLTESRLAYVTPDKLRLAKSYLREDQVLEYALGYESVNEKIRNEVLRKGVPEHHLDQALDMSKEADVDFASYVLIKPHTLTEADAITEAVDTAIHVLRKAQERGVQGRINFEPVFVTRGKELEESFIRGEYTPPRLWSVVEVIKQTANLLAVENTEGKLFVGLSDENLSSKRMTANCGECDSRVIAALQEFNRNQDITTLEHLDCHCRAEWEQSLKTEGAQG